MPAPARLAAANVFSRLNENGNAIRLIWNRTRSRIHLGRSSRWGDDRVSYQQRYIGFDIEPGQRVLDVGSGG
jgi:hypothetical protein